MLLVECYALMVSGRGKADYVCMQHVGNPRANPMPAVGLGRLASLGSNVGCWPICASLYK